MTDRWGFSSAQHSGELVRSVSVNRSVTRPTLTDITEARRFLTLLDPTAAIFTFQTFADRKAAAAPATKIFTASFDEASVELSRLNQSGAGVFVTANETDGSGRKARNITRIRAIWQDDDEGWVGAFPLVPSATIQTSPGKFQRWWFIDPSSNLSVEDHRGIMQRMARDHGCDANAVDVSRVLRLPGFLHQKGHPFRVRIVDSAGLTYSAESLLAAFPRIPLKAAHVGALPATQVQRDIREVEKALAFIPAHARGIWLRCGMGLHDFTAGSQEGFDLWSRWSQTAPETFDAANQLRTWKSLSLGRGVTIAAIFDLAKSFGADVADLARSHALSPRGSPMRVRPKGEVARDECRPPDMSIINRNQLAAPPFPIELLGPAQDWVRAAAAARNAPVDFVALGLIATAAGLLGPSIQVSPWGDWKERSILWACLIGAPSSNKSPAIDPLRDALRSVEQQMSTMSASGGSKKSRILISDVTTEKAGQLLADNPHGLICIRDELSGLLGGFGRYGSSGADRAFWIEAYGGRRHVVDRVKHEEPIDIPYCGISLVGGIQPDRLGSLLFAGDDDGLASRFLYAWPPQSPRRRTSIVPDAKMLADVFRRLREVSLSHGDEPQDLIIMLEPLAVDEFGAWYEREEHDAWATGLLASAYGKLHGIMLRLALVIEFLTWAFERGNEPAPSTISTDSVMAAIAIVEQWVRPTLRRVFAEASLPKAYQDARIVGLWLLQQRLDYVNSRRIRRAAGFPGPKEPKELDAALEVLVDWEWLVLEPARDGHTPGRLRKDYRVNVLIYELAEGIVCR